MQLGMIGLGRMGGNMVARLRQGGHAVVGYDRSPESGRDVASLAELRDTLAAPRVIWVMVPSGAPTESTIAELGDLLDPGDLVIDGGNSPYKEDQKHAEQLAAKGIHFADCGVSGGVWGLDNGYALMAGGAPEDIARAQPIFDTLKPSGDAGFVHAGPVGAGHFTKMVHNGIEYGMMQAYGEGYALMEASDLVPNPDAVVASWQEGTVIRSWLLDLLIRALKDDPNLTAIEGRAEDSGEARWMVNAAIELGVPIPATTTALFERLTSRDDVKPAMKVVAAMRNQFGGHAVTSSK